MRGATRVGQDSAGGVLISGSPDVIVNGSNQVRVGDLVAGHGPGVHSGPVMVSGSPDVIVNGIPSCRVGDLASCGHQSSGSADVFIN